MTSTVVLSPRGEQRLSTGHPWIYRADVARVDAEPGARVAVLGARGRILGHAFFSDRSQIALRLLSYGSEPADDTLIRRRLEAAMTFRQQLDLDGTAYRLVHGEGDLLPSIVIDRYGDHLVVQALSQGSERLLPALVVMLQELFQPAGILARNDSRARLLEGLPQTVDVLAGDVPAVVTVTQSGIEYAVDLHHGQKTGLFLDQRENREAARAYARGRLLDAFSYHGGFALTLASRCSETLALDASDDAVRHLQANAARNALTVDARVGNVFDELRGLERLGERFDTIVLDPPAFAKTKAAVPKATAGYKEINLRALKLLAAGGTLITCSCSYHVSEAALTGIVHEAAMDAGIQVSLVEKRMQSRDHPVLLQAPETYYLKCLVLRRLP